MKDFTAFIILTAILIVVIYIATIARGQSYLGNAIGHNLMALQANMEDTQ